MSEKIFVSSSEEETVLFATDFAKSLKKGEIILLNGDLGSGKSDFARGVIRAFGVKKQIPSPTFTIVQEYTEGRLPFYHFDVYRIGDISEMDEIGYEDYFFGEGVCFIEWATMIEEILPDNVTWIKIEKDLEKGFDYRKITITE